MSTEFFRISQLPQYQLGDIAKAIQNARTNGRDIIDLSQVNPNLGPPASAVEKLVQSALQPHNHRYSASQGIIRLREACAGWYASRFGVTLSPESEVVVTMGVKEGLSHLLLSVASPGDTIMVPTPSYPIHTSAVFIAGAAFVGVPLFESHANTPEVNYELSENNDDFFATLDLSYHRTWPRPRVLVCSFPHNPTTAVVTKGFLSRLVGFCREHQVYLVHDFAYADLCFDDYRAPSVLQIDGAKDIAVEFYSLSKGFNLAGWRLAFCVGNPKLVSALKKIKSYLDFGVFQPIQIAGAALLEQAAANPELALNETVSTYQGRRDVLCSGLSSAGWNIRSPRATVFVWTELPEVYRNRGSLAFCQELLEQAGVALCPGIGFDVLADGHVRFALVEDEKRLREAVRRISRIAA